MFDPTIKYDANHINENINNSIPYFKFLFVIAFLLVELYKMEKHMKLKTLRFLYILYMLILIVNNGKEITAYKLIIKQ